MNRVGLTWCWMAVAAFVLSITAVTLPRSTATAHEAYACAMSDAPSQHGPCCSQALAPDCCIAACGATLPPPASSDEAPASDSAVRYPEVAVSLRGVTHDPEHPPPR